MPLKPYRDYLSMLPPDLTTVERQAAACLLRAEWLLIHDAEGVKRETLIGLEDAARRLTVSSEGSRWVDAAQTMWRHMWDDYNVCYCNNCYVCYCNNCADKE